MNWGGTESIQVPAYFPGTCLDTASFIKSSLNLQVCLRCPRVPRCTLHSPHVNTCHSLLEFPVYFSVTSKSIGSVKARIPFILSLLISPVPPAMLVLTRYSVNIYKVANISPRTFYMPGTLQILSYYELAHQFPQYPFAIFHCNR